MRHCFANIVLLLIFCLSFNLTADDIYFKNSYVLKNVKIIKRDAKWIEVQTTEGEAKYAVKSVFKIEKSPFDSNGQTQMLLTDKRNADEKMAPGIGYIHIGWGGSMDINSSDDIEMLMDPFKIQTLSLDNHFNLIAGFKNIAQIEIRNSTIKGIDLWYKQGNYLQNGDRYEVKMKLSTSQWIVKFNPFFVVNPPYLAVFAMYGQGTSSYVDDHGDGFKNGKNRLFGIEFYYLAKYFSASLNLQWHTITFNKFDIQSIGYLEQKFEMSRLIFGVSLNIGMGA